MKTEESLDKQKLKRIFILKKYKSCLDNQQKIKQEIKNYLRTEKILEFSDKILIGTLVKQKCPRFDKNKQLIPYSYVGPNKIFSLKRRKAIKNSLAFSISHFEEQNKFNQNNNIKIHRNISEKSRNNTISHDLNENTHEKENNNQNEGFFKIIDNQTLNGIYKSIYNKIKKNHSMKNNDYHKAKNRLVDNYCKFSKTINKKLSQIPESLSRNLLRQEKILKNNDNFEKIRQNINKIITKKAHKISKDLLVNTVDNNKCLKSKFDKNALNNLILRNWNFKLRNPKKNGLYERNGYFKTTMTNDELYSVINLNKDKEVFVNSLLKNINRNYYNIRKKNLNKEWGKIECLESINVKGNNLLEYEFKNEMEIKGKKKLYDTMKLDKIRYKDENKEKISGYDLEKNLKDFYKDKVFAFDYDNKNDSTSNSYRKLIFHTRNNC
jgi:hypothetical protein